jgi:hypothetical protein
LAEHQPNAKSGRPGWQGHILQKQNGGVNPLELQFDLLGRDS